MSFDSLWNCSLIFLSHGNKGVFIGAVVPRKNVETKANISTVFIWFCDTGFLIQNLRHHVTAMNGDLI